MLQQTRVAAVLPYYRRWMERFPTLAHLAAADEQEVLHAWQGLGYYSRARNLLRGAREVRDRLDGRMPETAEELRRLPGIGPYTAGAIASIAFRRAEPVLDGNVVRVLARLFALPGDPTRGPLRRRLWELAAALLPPEAPGDFNQALMELGAVLCTPRGPRCGECPLRARCRAVAEGFPERYPELPARPSPTPISAAAAVVWQGSRVLLVQRRRDEARWPGMWQFPSAELREGEEAADCAARAVQESVGLTVRTGRVLPPVRHAVTRWRILLTPVCCDAVAGRESAAGCPDWRWLEPEEVSSLPLPAAHVRVARLAAAEGSQRGPGF